jgi:hypothetical protein
VIAQLRQAEIENLGIAILGAGAVPLSFRLQKYVQWLLTQLTQ